MSFKSKLTLDSNFFNAAARKQAFAAAVVQSAKEFKNDLKTKMKTGPHTGNITTRGKTRGENFRRRHQASRRGERPSPDTNSLVDSIEAKRLDDLSAQVEVTKPYLDKSGEEVLQNKLGRKIMVDEDITEAEISFNKRLNSALSNLIDNG